MANWPIIENYTNSLGEFVGYDTENGPLLVTASGVIIATVSGVQSSVLSNQEHIDIRGLVPSGIVQIFQYDMLELAPDTMSELDTLTMGQLSSYASYGDEWSQGTVGPIPTMSNVVGLTWTLVSGTNTTSSTQAPVNLSTGFQPTDYICLSLPSFPASLINKSSSYLTLYDGINTTNLYLNQSFVPLTSGNTCAAWYYSQLGLVQEPVTVSLTMVAESVCTVYITGIRLISQNWSPLTLDMNTEGQFLRPITTQSGTIPSAPYPTAWRCAVPQGINDPRPINASFGALFYTGSLTENSTINIYQRGRSEAVITQLDLDYVNSSVGYTQGDLDALGHQPDFGTSYFSPSTQAILNMENQTQLNLQEQWQLERIADITNQYWIQSALTYQPNSGFTVGINNYTSVGGTAYISTASGILPNSYYLFNTDVQDDTVRITVDPVTKYGVVTSGRLFDSQTIQNNFFRRTAGRIGWGVQFGDGDAFIKTFLSQSLMFAEYKSKIFQTRTPVKGASLTVGATPPLQLYQASGPYENASVTTNFAISNSSIGSQQVTITSPGQGLITNNFFVSDFTQFEIDFDLYLPSATLNQGSVICFLINSFNYITPLPIGQILPNSWQSFTINSNTFSGLIPGSYAFAILCFVSSPVTFYVSNIALQQTVIRWAIRSAYQDPWVSGTAPWTTVPDLLLNNTSNGVLCEPPGSSLQVRAMAYQQNATIGSYALQPLYSQLGNVIFP